MVSRAKSRQADRATHHDGPTIPLILQWSTSSATGVAGGGVADAPSDAIALLDAHVSVARDGRAQRLPLVCACPRRSGEKPCVWQWPQCRFSTQHIVAAGRT